MDDKVLERARRISKARNVSISRMFVAMIYQMDAEDMGQQSLPPVTSQLQSAIKAGCSRLFTRDRTHFRSSAIAVMPPSSFVA